MGQFTAAISKFKIKSRYYCTSGLTALTRLLFCAEGAQHRAAHECFRRALLQPDFPLCDALREKHLHTGHGGNPFFRGDLQELGFLRPVDQVHDHAAIQLAGRQRRDSILRMHADRCGVQDGVKEFRAQSAAGNDFSSDGASQLFRGFFTPRANANYRASTSQRKCRGSRRSTRAENQYAAAFDAEFLLERAEHADVIRVATVERTVAPDYNGIHGADVRSQRLAFLQMLQNGLLVRQRHAETPDAEFGNGLEEITELMNQEWEIDSVHFARDESCVVQQGRKRMSDGIANHPVNSRLSRERVSAVEMLHFVEGDLSGRGCLSDRCVCQRAAFSQWQDSAGQTHCPHRNGYKVLRAPRQAKQPDAVGNRACACGDFYGVNQPMTRSE